MRNLILLGVVLVACTSVNQFPIGGGAKISGKIEDWPTGTVSGILSTHFIWTSTTFGPNIGKIEADGSFTLGLPTDAEVQNLANTASFVGCDGPKPTVTPDDAKIYPIAFLWSISGQDSGFLLNTDKVPALGREASDSLGARLVYSNTAVTIMGQCRNYADTFDLTLQPGWNTVVVSTNASSQHTYQVAAAPANLKWFKSK